METDHANLNLTHPFVNVTDNICDSLSDELGCLESLWNDTRSHWDDPVAEHLEHQVILPFQLAIRELRQTLLEHAPNTESA